MCDINIAKRICLKCQKLFKSNSFGNRICNRCDYNNGKLRGGLPVVRGVAYRNGIPLYQNDGTKIYLEGNL